MAPASTWHPQSSRRGLVLAPAHSWHSQRRAALLRDEAVKRLVKDCGKNARADALCSLAIFVFVLCLHISTMLLLRRCALHSSAETATIVVFGAAATVGAQSAYLVQAFNHELAHICARLNSSKLAEASADVALRAGSFAASVLGASLCHLPWAAYYWAHGHQRHHVHTGSSKDVDFDSLFWIWQPPMHWGVAARVCWASIAAILLPFAYIFALAESTWYRGWQSNKDELVMVGMDCLLTGAVYVMAGTVGAVYLWMSSLFSMGFLCHPLIAFWILQHLCASSKTQPTVSYYGSQFWNLLCLNQLLHVEHHDLTIITWWHMPKLRKLVPDLYDDLYTERSVFQLILSWLRSDRDTQSSDFACLKTVKWARGQVEAMEQAERNWQPYTPSTRPPDTAFKIPSFLRSLLL
eukprot:TRINITY_DN10621_c0_g1_i1.p1 TRINITY_DN10621_c0_g1~~TRINITY_DN10621_c0_g1_i1.p1  ORF type:complete len:408 (-),score=44.06 TRINITY_DN10621_c0_g1_i1:265-1488(-)